MAIQTAGEQKYYDFIEERARKLRTGMIVWISLLAAALIASFNSLLIGGLLALAGIFLGVLNIRNQKALKDKLAVVEDRADFFNQLIAPETVEIPSFRLLVTRDYVLVFRTDVYLYRFADMEKVEVGIGTAGEKALFLTDRRGVRCEIARTAGGPDAEFDRAYEAVRERMEER